MNVAPERITTLDGLRGLAVMGILLMNITAFALPEGAYFNPAAYGADGPDDYVAWALTATLVDGKMRGLFSLLFGASMLLVAERAEAAGEDEAGVHYRRIVVLLLFGLAHTYLIWWGDILIHYAVVGSVAFLFRNRSTGALVRLGVAFFALQVAIGALLMFGMADVQARALAPGATPAAVGAWLDARAELGVATPDRLAAQIATWRGDYAIIFRALTVDKGWDQAFYLIGGGAETLGLMLFGIAGLRSGFLTGAWPRAAYARIMLWGYGLGVPASALLAALAVASGFDSFSTFALAYAAATPFRPLVMAGHAALAILWLTGGAGGLRPRVIAAGRVAFTNYLGSSLVMTFLFYGWGLGLFATIGRAELYLVVLAAWTIMLAWSQPWLAAHAYGPLEWLWRSLARGKAQAWRRKSAA